MYLKSSLNNSKKTKFLLEIEGGAHAHDMNREDLVDEIEPGASFTTCKEYRSAVRQMFAKIPFCASFTMCTTGIWWWYWSLMSEMI